MGHADVPQVQGQRLCLRRASNPKIKSTLFRTGNDMRRSFLAAGYLAVAISGIEVGSATAQDAVKIGVVIPMTGAFAAVGREVAAGAKLYMQQHGDTVAVCRRAAFMRCKPAAG